MELGAWGNEYRKQKGSWQLAVGSPVKLIIYDITGRKVVTLVDGWQSAGTYSTNFDASGLAGGIYFYRLATAEFTETRKMLLLK